jgi:hypothetical protein
MLSITTGEGVGVSLLCSALLGLQDRNVPLSNRRTPTGLLGLPRESRHR